MTTNDQSCFPYGRFLWRCLPVALAPLLLLLLVRPLASRKAAPHIPPDPMVWLNRTDILQRDIVPLNIVYEGIAPLKLPPVNFPEIRTMRVTAYCPCKKCCGPGASGQTASGHRIRAGDVFVAAPREVAIGTRLIVPGYNSDLPVTVLDRGGAIRGERLDIFFASHRKAIGWGTKDLAIIIETPNAPFAPQP